MPRGTQVKKDGLAITVKKEEHLKQDCPHASKLPPAPCPVCKGPHWRRECPQKHRFQGSDSQDNLDRRCLGVPTQALIVIPEEPQVLITVGGQSTDFLLDTGANFSVLTEAPAHFLPDRLP